MWIASGASLILSFVGPRLLVPLYLGMTAIAFPIGFVVGNVILGLLFGLLFTPLALFFRLRKRDELKLAIEPDAESYWVQVKANTAAESYFKQY